jgi:hypothetical protein
MLNRRQHDLGRERERGERRGRCDGSVVDRAEAAGAARRVVEVVVGRRAAVQAVAAVGGRALDERVAAASAELGEPMRGDDISQLAEGELLARRGW